LPSPLLLSPASAVRGGFPLRVTTSTTATATSRTTPMPNAEIGRMVNRGLAARPPSSTRGAGHGDNGASAAPPATGEGAGGDNASSAIPEPRGWQWLVGSTSRANERREEGGDGEQGDKEPLRNERADIGIAIEGGGAQRNVGLRRSRVTRETL
jgi:hypothetical protein